MPDEAVRKELISTGKLRVGIGVGAAPSAFWATRDPATSKPRGVTVSLGQALADRLGVPLELVIYPNSGEVTAGGPKGEWDVAFMPEDAERRKPFIQQCASRRSAGARRGSSILLTVGAEADTEHEAAAGQYIERCRLLREDDRIA